MGNNRKTINKLPLLAVGLLLASAAIVFTIAYNANIATLSNDFAMAKYEIIATEEFTSPDNWKPCDETEKLFTITNNGTVDVAVRLKYEEYWRNKADTTTLPLEKDGVRLATISFQNESDWELREDGYYYYKTSLAPGATTSSLFKSVKLDCNADFGKTNVCRTTTTGVVCEKPADEYEGAKYHLRITAETIQYDASSEWAETIAGDVEDQVNPDYDIDFRRPAIDSDDLYLKNGNGINRMTEKGQTIYYYRGQIDNNNVIWSGLCWKIVRTTYTGGTKIIYNGEPTTVDGKQQCLATGTAAQISLNGANTFRFNNNQNSPADGGYMYGTRYVAERVEPVVSGYVFGNDVFYDSGNYTLTNTLTLTDWNSQQGSIAHDHHYTCLSSSTTCSTVYYLDFVSSQEKYAFALTGGTNFEQMKTAMDANTNDSAIKSTIDAWFEAKGLDDDELDDAVYCNDRSYYAGFLKGKTTDIGVFDTDHVFTRGVYYNLTGSYGRIAVGVSETGSKDNLRLDCPNKNDAFTKEDTVNGNAKLTHKVGLVTGDELTLAGIGWEEESDRNYLYTGQFSWTMSLDTQGGGNKMQGFGWTTWIWGGNDMTALGAVRPVVTLKAGAEVRSGTGRKVDPYIIR